MFLLNGQSADSIDLLDRGLHYGDGLFETIAVINEQPLCLDKHLQRLLSGCERLKFDFDDIEILQSEINSICKDTDRAVLKIIVTSGTGGRGYKRNCSDLKPTRLLATYPWPQYPDNYLSQGIQVHLCSSRLGHNPGLAGIKHLNRLEQVLARNEWDDTNTMEGLMLDIDDNIIEGTMSNLFIILPDKKLVTPDVSLCGIAGIVRQYIIDNCAELAYTSDVKKISLEDVYAASEMFFCNSVAGIMPVRQLSNHKFPAQLAANKIRQFLISRAVIAPS
ncbi:MAG: aminodeoxychorismate lyase [Gammaproteobacteria bacterium]|nr:MAG: aminodeoxychorismate lyase [Gammaproteobacteria bacterium]